MTAVADMLAWMGSDPGFWMPLVGMALLLALLAGVVVLDGFAIGVACLCLLAPAHVRASMRSLLNPGRDAHRVCLPLGFGVFLTVFPYAVRPLFGALALPLGLLALGTLLRGVALAFRLRAPRTLHVKLELGVSLGAWLVAVAHGLLLSAFVLQFDVFPGSLWFTAFSVLGVVAAYSLLGATWLLLRASAELRHVAVRWAHHALRWVVAGAVGVCTVLGLLNPGVLLRWGVGLPVSTVVTLWVMLLASVVVIDIVLRRPARATAIPFLLTLLTMLLGLGGVCYSVFPDLVLGELTLWDAAASVPTLRVVLPVWIGAVGVLLVFALYRYRR